MYYNYRQMYLLYLFIITVAITILAGEYWKFFFILPFSVFNWYLADMMFFTKGQYMYEPNYHYWQEANEVEY